jgi:hypothetical protein
MISSGMDMDSTRSGSGVDISQGSGVDISQDCSPMQSNTNSALSSPVNSKRKQVEHF